MPGTDVDVQIARLLELADEAHRAGAVIRAASAVAGQDWRGRTRRWFDDALTDVTRSLAGVTETAAEEATAAAGSRP